MGSEKLFSYLATDKLSNSSFLAYAEQLICRTSPLGAPTLSMLPAVTAGFFQKHPMKNYEEIIIPSAIFMYVIKLTKAQCL